MLYDILYWYLVIGFVLAVIGDGFNAIQAYRKGLPHDSENRFFLWDTVVVTTIWPVVLWVAIKSVMEDARRGL